MAQDAPIHQLVGLLAAFDAAALSELQRRHPGALELRPGRPLGALSLAQSVRVEVAMRGLRAMVALGDAIADRHAVRIRRSHRVESVAQAVALVGSGGVLVALLGDGSQMLKIATAAIGTIGSLSALLVKFMRRDLSGGENGLIAQHVALARMGGQAVSTAARLAPYERSADDLGEPEALRSTIEEANRLAGEIYTLAKQAGARVPVLP